MAIDAQKGYVKMDTDDALQIVQGFIFNQFGNDINLDDGSVMGAFYNVLGQVLEFMDDMGLSIHDSMLLLKSSGQALDDITSDEGTYRKVATNASTSLLITGYVNPNSPTIITPDNGEYSTADGQIFRITDTVTISQQATDSAGQPLVDEDGNALGQATVNAVSEDAGVEQNVAPNSIINAEQSVDGFYSVTNPNKALGGLDIETDDKLKQRAFENRIAKPNGTQDGLTTALRNIDDVKDARVISNRLYETDSYGNPPKSTHAYVLGGQPNEIAQCLLDNAVLDSQFIGSSQGTAYDVSNKAYTINYDQSPQVQVYIKVNITVSNDFNNDYGTQAIQTAISNYFDDLTMGNSVNFTKLYSPVYTVNGVTDATISMGTGSANNVQPNTSITVKDMEVPVVANIDVEVTS